MFDYICSVRNKDYLKENLIKSEAITMIVEHGFDGLSMKKLAQRVHISASTIYVYFESREDLLNKIFLEVQEKFEEDALNNFIATMDFEDGLWLQWKNRFENIQKNPVEFEFYEQFRNSPLINSEELHLKTFRKEMNDFVENAMQQEKIKRLPPEIFWAVAYGPFYTLVKFHLNQSTMANKPFALTENKLKQTFELVLSALR